MTSVGYRQDMQLICDKLNEHCEVIERIDHINNIKVKEIEQRLDSINYSINNHAERINSLIDHKTRQIDENRKISARVDELESETNRLRKLNLHNVGFIHDINQRLKHSAIVSEEEMAQIHQDIDDLDDQDTLMIHKIEEYKDVIIKICDVNNERINKNIEVIDQILKSIEKLEQRVTHLENKSSSSKNPHKCPVCDGKGKISSWGQEVCECHACEGKGIVWG